MDSTNEELALRRRIAEQHDHLIGLEEANHRAILGALQALNKTISQATKVPVAMAIMGFTSWLLYMGHLDQRTWAFCFATAVFPWFGDHIRTIVEVIRGNKISGKDVSVIVIKGSVIAVWVWEVARHA